MSGRHRYEGQAAIELEQLADPAERAAYPVSMTRADRLLVHGTDLIQAVVAEQRAGVAAPTIAARFHHGLARAVVQACVAIRDDTGLSTVAFSGGVFQNVLLLTRVHDGLTAHGFEVLTHTRVPPNDAGISLGQAVVAGALDKQTLAI